MSFFREFSEIETRVESITDAGPLEKLLEVEREIIKQYQEDERFHRFSYANDNEIYKAILQSTTDLIRNISLSAELLQEYVYARQNSVGENGKTRGGKPGLKPAFARGIFSAALLEILCTRTDDPIEINGNGKKFDYLFFHAKYARDVYVKNFKGDYIFAALCCYGRNARNITVSEIEGKATLSHLGYNRGNVRNVIATKMKGSHTLYAATNTTNLTLLGIQGDHTLHGVGSSDWENGVNFSKGLTNVSLADISGRDILKDVGSGTNRYGSEWVMRLQEAQPHEGREGIRNIITHLGETHFSRGGLRNHHFYQSLNQGRKELFDRVILLAQTIFDVPLAERSRVHDEIAQINERIYS